MRIWLDRKFFRAALEKEQMLSALIDRVKGVESEEELCLAAGRELEAALHVNGCHFFLLSHDGRMRVAYSQSPEVAARLRGWLNGEGLTLLGGESIVPLYEPPSSGSLEGEPDQDPTEYLAVPITGTRARAVGILVLGPKRSEQPYTEPERGLLKSIAAQMAILHEILNLKERVQKEERVRVQVLGRLDQQGVRLLNECPDCGRCYTSGVSICEHDGTSLSLTLPIERTIEERYLLERRIGHGGMGVVYRAHDVRLDRQVAVKVLLGDLFGNSAAMARLEREARAAAALNHPNIVGVYDIGRLPSGGAYLVMELIDGNSWREHLKGLRRIALDRAFGWLRDLCSAMEGAHASGIIHRDLKPENIMIGESGGVERAIVLDFGLAKICADLSREEKELTISGAVMGTRGYMSPEQRSGRKVDPRTDVFSVAVICAETVTGNRPPRCGASIQWLDGCLRARTPVELRLRRVLRQGLEERPNRRPTMRDFREQLSGAVLIGARAVAAVDAERAATVTLPPRGGDNR